VTAAVVAAGRNHEAGPPTWSSPPLLERAWSPGSPFPRLSCWPPCLSLGGRRDAGRQPRNPGLSSSSGNGLPSGVVRSWRTGSAPGGTSPCSAWTRWR